MELHDDVAQKGWGYERRSPGTAYPFSDARANGSALYFMLDVADRVDSKGQEMAIPPLSNLAQSL
jgi:hypothetical protein